ncbi:MAG: hypothetical protein A3I75_04405 [Deltaproteobacteria bacterium RIFCSPLOWO2_02_FULL_50_16]|nr:MAG: hypothetical protein A3B79_02220 [Deltaproteobacteria bacterium RIFCSPHIGHO2_02_FULL_50_15]OGQ57630.1 MAG: hypothetical protein A3I75_04405 [Deltaproteobacteria bacterium RIFCSPLOWO2_02_FULL_50_16]OGQ66060.1 MAG: hypothetical protein A3F89_01600 [Deltaproteobacteria bacterium RIFCSPLOWO2_12_FULL_50_11]
MGITLVQKSDLSRKKTNAKTALVLAGGAISGGTFKVGGIKALNDFLLNKKVTDFDIYVGLSAGGFLAAPLAGGIPPEEILKSLDGSSSYFTQLSPLHLYWPNFSDFVLRPLRYLYRRGIYIPSTIYDLLSTISSLRYTLKDGFLRFMSNPSYSNFEILIKPLARTMYSARSLPSIMEAIPQGLFDNKPIEKYLRENMKRNHLTNNFKVLKKLREKSLYITACNIETSERVVFGHDEKNDITISQAVQASTALPLFYKPARIKGVDYVDGAVRNTANIDLAIEKGADLIICYNPFRPFNNKIMIEYLKEENKYVTRNNRLSESGVFMILNQVFRTLLHTRLRHAVTYYEHNKNFKGDIILIEPKEDDARFFEMNPLAFWNRAKAAKLGFISVRDSINRRFDEISRILNSYGIEMTREVVELDINKMSKPSLDDSTIMNVLERESPRRHLHLVSGWE